jgi:futalosine hydrolase
MNYLIIAATPAEITPFLSELRKGKLSDADIDILITGIGLTATTYSLLKQFLIKKPELVIQAGVAGCFDKKIALGSVVAVKKDTIADESVIELKKLKTLFDLRLVPQNRYPYTKGWLVNNSNIMEKVKLKKVRGVSVNQITTSGLIKKFYKRQFNPVVESMEGSALHYVCLMEKISFVQLRSISNYIGERNKKNWNMKESIINLNKELINLLHKL